MRYQSLLEVDCAIKAGSRSLRLRGEQTEHMRGAECVLLELWLPLLGIPLECKSKSERWQIRVIPIIRLQTFTNLVWCKWSAGRSEFPRGLQMRRRDRARLGCAGSPLVFWWYGGG
jgi:hypothetical protein